MIDRAALFLAPVALALLVGCDAESTRDAQEKARETAKNVVDKSKEIGRETFATGKRLLIRGRAWSEYTLEELRDYGAQLIDEHGDDINAAGAKVDELLDHIARDPDTTVTPAAKISRMVILMIPFVGPTKRFADARALFESGLDRNDPARLQKARRECLIACAEAGLDIATLGLAGTQAHVVAAGVDRVFSALKLGRRINALTDGDLVILDRFLDDLLANEEVRDGIDRALTTDLSTIVPREQ